MTLSSPIDVIAVLPAAPLKITTNRYYSAPDLQQQTVVTSPTNCRLGPSPNRFYQLMRDLHEADAMTTPPNTAA